MLLQMAPNAPLAVLPQFVWVKVRADTAVHKVPASALFWDRNSLKTKQLGLVLEVHDNDPRAGALPPANLGPLPLPPPNLGPPPPPPPEFVTLAQKHKATRVHTYDQGSDNGLTNHQDTAEGACIYLSLRWLSDNKNGASFWDRLETSDTGAPALNESTRAAAIAHMSAELAAAANPEGNLSECRKARAAGMD